MNRKKRNIIHILLTLICLIIHNGCKDQVKKSPEPSPKLIGGVSEKQIFKELEKHNEKALLAPTVFDPQIPEELRERLKKRYTDPDIKEFLIKDVTSDIKIDKCPAHGEKLKRDFVMMNLGLKGYISPEDAVAEKELFPYAYTTYQKGYGAIINGSLEAVAKVLYCKKCREVEVKYSKIRESRLDKLIKEVEKEIHNKENVLRMAYSHPIDLGTFCANKKRNTK